MQAFWLSADALGILVVIYWTWLNEERGGRAVTGLFSYRQPEAAVAARPDTTPHAARRRWTTRTRGRN